MSAGYRAVQWSPGKRAYDAALAGLLVLYLALFTVATLVSRPEITVETALIRAFGTAALLLLHVVLAIGPLARLDRRFLPLLWNRRHLGVTMFGTALAHGGLATFQFHALGDRNPLVSLLASEPVVSLFAAEPLGALARFPFQPLGFAALVVLFLMAATSHDFWLSQLTAPVWKALHLGVYFAYALTVAHVALGALQDERAAAPALLLGVGLAGVLGLHLAAALRERRTDRELDAAGEAGWIEAGRVEEIAEKRARIVTLGGERVAIFRYDGRLSAVSNVCQHQNGPLGEGKIVDGCITCPWHGYQYRPGDGASPAPFTEKVPTFRVRVVDGRILVDPRPLAPGTPVEPATFDPATPARADREAFFVGYLPMPERLRGFQRRVVVGLAGIFAFVALTIGGSQRPLGAGEFEFGVESTVEGLLRSEPLAAIWTPGDAIDRPLNVIPLVGEGKHGPGTEILALAGGPVRARGSWIRRGRETLFEIHGAESLAEPYALPAAGGAGEVPTAGSGPAGAVRLRGEVVDSKCFLGVMKPGEGRSHRACAIRCISGGSPAAFVARDAGGRTAVLWMVSEAGRPLGRELLDLVGEPVEAAGELVRLGDRVLLVTDRAKIARLEPPAS